MFGGVHLYERKISCPKNHRCYKKGKLSELVLHTYNIRITWLYVSAYPQQICINDILHYSINRFIKIFAVLNIFYEYCCMNIVV